MKPIRSSALHRPEFLQSKDVSHPLVGVLHFSIQLIQVMEELEDKQLLGRLTMVEQENKELREVKFLPLWSKVLLHFNL